MGVVITEFIHHCLAEIEQLSKEDTMNHLEYARPWKPRIEKTLNNSLADIEVAYAKLDQDGLVNAEAIFQGFLQQYQLLIKHGVDNSEMLWNLYDFLDELPLRYLRLLKTLTR